MGFFVFDDRFSGGEARRTVACLGRRPQSGQSQEVVGRAGDLTLQLDLPSTHEPRPTQAADHISDQRVSILVCKSGATFLKENDDSLEYP